MNITGFSRVFLSQQKAEIVLKEYNGIKETMEKLKLENPTVRVNVRKKDCRLIPNNIEFKIYNNEEPTIYNVHSQDVEKIIQFINRERGNLIKEINDKAS
ncbi:hypothetical protein G3M54_00050 [Bacillus megaterium NBRC 15308 = ATCC 14581]|nr:hypothetical protein [Priestia megaterium NBRC 15308 = ATCC 14581]